MTEISKIQISWQDFQTRINPMMLEYYQGGGDHRWEATFNIELWEYTFTFKNISDYTEFYLRWF